ncbi:MAG: radical SAM protein [Deltaproteobacteria bacterium]|nr:radical SAM protein [Deltaproteobacteria bacterium]
MGNRVLSTLMLYITSRCNSRCKICNIWEQEKIDLSPEIVAKVIESKAINKKLTHIGIEGGEFLLHPQCKEIFKLLKGFDVGVISNGLLKKQLLDVVEEFNIKKVSISLDGRPQSYERVRGLPAYEKVVDTILSLKGKTDQLGVIYTQNPWNTNEDFEHVKKFCKQHNINFGFGIYINRNLFDSSITPEGITYGEQTYRNSKQEFAYFYDKWLKKEVMLPCLSIRQVSVIWPNGDVPLCQGAGLILGNVHTKSFDEIWTCEKSMELQKDYTTCNRCWVTFHREFDLGFFKIATRFLPGKLLESFYGEIKFPKYKST